MDKLNWGILGPGGIAKAFAKGVAASKTGKVVAVGSRSKEKADTFANEFQIPKRPYRLLPFSDRKPHVNPWVAQTKGGQSFRRKIFRGADHARCDLPAFDALELSDLLAAFGKKRLDTVRGP